MNRSWNPRTFAENVRGTRMLAEMTDPMLVWLTSAARERMRTFPVSTGETAILPTGLIIGLADPLEGCADDDWQVIAVEPQPTLPLFPGAVMASELSLWSPESDSGVYGYSHRVLGEHADRVVARREAAAWLHYDPASVAVMSGAERTAAENLIIATLLMLNDVEARADAACTREDQSIGQVRRRGVAISGISIIDVRRRSPSTPAAGEHRRVEHDHRWTVRGHWRQQPFGPGRQQRRRIWIAEHVAGPEDMPVRSPTRVYRV